MLRLISVFSIVSFAFAATPRDIVVWDF